MTRDKTLKYWKCAAELTRVGWPSDLISQTLSLSTPARTHNNEYVHIHWFQKYEI